MTVTNFSRIWQAMARRRERRSARQALFKMSDPILKDIGIARSHIDAAVRGDVIRRSRRDYST